MEMLIVALLIYCLVLTVLFICMMRDVHDLKENIQAIRRKKIYDDLTEARDGT